MKKTNIVIIDDDKGILEAIALVLEDAGYSVYSFIKTAEVYNKVLSIKPDLIILDLLLSGRDGREICKNFKSNSLTKEIPIIMSSAHPNAKLVAAESGADGFLSKPFDAEELLTTVKKFLSTK